MYMYVVRYTCLWAPSPAGPVGPASHRPVLQPVALPPVVRLAQLGQQCSSGPSLRALHCLAEGLALRTRPAQSPIGVLRLHRRPPGPAPALEPHPQGGGAAREGESPAAVHPRRCAPGPCRVLARRSAGLSRGLRPCGAFGRPCACAGGPW
eukprot:6793823-Lingulodinium_polyedra.AAC.1